MPTLQLLTLTTLFPDSTRPNQGVFVENRLRHLVETGAVRSVVLSPVPWFPSTNPIFGYRAAAARVPRQETRNGLQVHHPRYPVVPKFGTNLAPFLLYAAMRPVLARLLREIPRPDLIDAHFIYPCGVAAVWLGRHFNLPVVLTSRGPAATELPDHPLPRRLIRHALQQADALISVSAGLKQELVACGAPPENVTVLRNGVDLALFHPPADREAARQGFGITRPTLVSVGSLIPRKRHDLTIEAMRHLPDWGLLIAGSGPERGALQNRIDAVGLADRVRLLGALPHVDLPRLYGAADASVLASSQEGWANVLLESMACGAPALASDIPGNTEVVRERAAGLILPANTPDGLAAAVRNLAQNPPTRAETRRYAERFSWDATSTGQRQIFESVLRRRSQGASPANPLPA